MRSERVDEKKNIHQNNSHPFHNSIENVEKINNVIREREN